MKNGALIAMTMMMSFGAMGGGAALAATGREEAAGGGGAPAECRPGEGRPCNDGWTFLPEQDSKSLLAQIEIVVRSGSMSDPARLPGLAYFTGRALLRGTRTRPYAELTESIERIGASLSVRVDQTQTTLSGKVVARNLDAFLDIVRDVLSQPAFETLEMTSLQNVIEGELRSALQEPRTVAARAAMSKAYAGTPLATASQGSVEGVRRVKPQDAADFYKAKYVRENMVVAFVSPLPVDQAVAKLQTKLDSVGHGALDAPRLPAPTARGRHAVIVDRKGMATAPIYIAVPGVADSDAELLGLEVGNFVFGADFTSRLMQVLRAENGWTYGAYSGYTQLVGAKGDAGLFSIYTFPSVEYVAQALGKAVSMLEDYSKRGVTAEEFVAARDALSNRYPFEIDTAEKRLELKLRDVLNGRPYETTDAYRKRLAALELGSMNGLIARRTPTLDMTIAVVGDATVLKPILAALPLVESVEVLDVQP